MNQPLKIRPHLIPFLFKEMEGSEQDYIKRKTTAITINQFSSLGKFLHSEIGTDKPEIFVLKLILEKKALNIYDGQIFISQRNKTIPVLLPEIKIIAINNLIDDIFRISFIYFIDGFISFAPQRCITMAIDKFIDKYDLLELGFTTSGLRSMYYRNKQSPLERMQISPSNHALHFSV
jgi:hypothetical protein